MQQTTSLMCTERALPCHTRNRFMLTNLACPISGLRGGMRLGYTLRYRDYTIERLGIMAQKAEKTLLKIINE